VGLQFDSPLYLLLLAPAALYVYWLARTAHRLSGWRKRIALTLRALVIILLVLALSGLQTWIPIERKAVVFVADRSDSIENPETIASWIRQSASQKKDDDLAGVVSAGLDAVIEKMPDAFGADQFSFASRVNSEFTRLDSALQLAETLMPDDASPRIVLISDGKENVGDLLQQGAILRDKGIPVDVLPLVQAERRDAAVESLKLPETLFQAEQYALEVTIVSTFDGSGVLRIYEDDRELTSQQVTLSRGENRFALRSLAKAPGLHRYRAELYADGDEVSANNAAYAFSRVSGPPKVLLVEGGDGEAQNLASVFDSGLIAYDRIIPEMLPQELADYTAYDSIVLANVPATRISAAQMEMIEQSVRDYGVGLVMTGGENSFGLGGYFQTPIERALPVYMDLRGKREIPSLALMLVMDKSGSMSGEKIELAQEAASRTVQLLRDSKDTVGVLAFDSSPWWVVEPQLITDKKKIEEQIHSIRADGGTEVYGAVAEAYRRLSGIEAQRRHIILLTDGQSATNQSYEALASEMVQNNITLSTVAIGDGADTQLLETIARLANGRYYFTNDHSTVPAIFSREAILVSRTYIVDQPFVPAIGQAADWEPMFAGGLPRVNAYIATTAKETAEAALVSPEPDPLLARWQYGAGKAAAWTSDLTGKWSGDWTVWDQFPDVFSRIVKWTFPQFESSAYELTSRMIGNEAQITVRSAAGDPAGGSGEAGGLKLVLTDEELNRQELLLEPTAPGEYSGRLPVAKPGVYLASIERANGQPGGADDPDGGAVAGAGVTTGFVIPYSPEYRIAAQDGAAKLAKLAEMTGGRVLSADRPGEVFQGAAAVKKQVHDLSRALLIAALMIWLADIAVRRLYLPWGRLADALLTLLRLRRPAPAAAGAGGTLERLRARVAERGAGAGTSGAAASRASRGKRDGSVAQQTDVPGGAAQGRAAGAAAGPAAGSAAPATPGAPPSPAASADAAPAARGPAAPAARGSSAGAARAPGAAPGAPRPPASASPPLGGAAEQAPPPPAASQDDSAAERLNRLLAAKNRRSR
jgi:uncharacterized membrane protein/uncharacterized protein YegL